MDSETFYRALLRPFPVARLHWRLGATDAKRNDGIPTKGVPLAYIDARDVMHRLDEVAGPFGWQTTMQEVAGTCAVSLAVLVDGVWITRTDTAGQTDVEGEKGAASTALRRAAAQFGIGRYLYRLENKWVELQKKGQHYAGSFKGAGALYFDTPSLPEWASPEGFDRIMDKRNAA